MQCHKYGGLMYHPLNALSSFECPDSCLSFTQYYGKEQEKQKASGKQKHTQISIPD